MGQRKTLTVRQVDVLRWIGDGCPDGGMVSENHHERITAGALRNRGLVTTKSRGATWSASITQMGAEYLSNVDGPTPPIPRQPNRPASQQLIDEIIAAGGTLRVPRQWGYRVPGQPDYERRAALAERNGKVPPGKQLVLTRTGDELRLDLVDAPEGTPSEEHPVPVPARVSRYHPIVTEIRDAEDRHEVTRAQLPRVLRLLQGLVAEAERRGFTVKTPSKAPVSTVGQADWSGERDGHLQIGVADTPVTLRVREDGMRGRTVYPQHYRYQRDDQVPGRRSMAHEAGAKGTVRISIISPHSPSNRQSSWGDGKKRTLEEQLPAVLMEVEVIAAEARERLRLEREEADRRRLAWEAAIERATARHTDHHRAELLHAQVEAWRRANEIRAYCTAVEQRQSGDVAALEWCAWARSHAEAIDPLSGRVEIPEPPTKVSREDLRPFLDGWDPYDPSRSSPAHR